ncbi:MAG: histidine phosphatase family protein [Firmicutes bacterium]|nr:histidine phosphatase family protein [Candidatus Fermentithermobacillaceae bacterium]
MRRIYLVRHGRTDWNRQEIFRGKIDVPLDDVGRRQAELVREFLLEICAARGERLTKVISSPLARAREMAEIIRSGFDGAALEVDESFSDIDVGKWGGLYVSQVEREFPREFRTWVERPDEMRFPSGESLHDVMERAWNKLMNILDDLGRTGNATGSGDICIVSHRVVLKVLLLTAIDAPLRSFWKLKVDTGSVSILETCDESGLAVAAVNITSHLAKLGAADRRDF